jgi:hypothetical protein
MLPQDWQIQHRSDCCAQTGRPFAPGEYFYTLLLSGKEGFQRLDLSEEAWKQRAAEEKQAGGKVEAPLCFWRAKFQPPASPASEALPKENAETLLRQYLAGGRPEHARTCYILALMLERKRLLRPIETRQMPGAEGARLLVYEHAKTGEIFVVVDPQLKLDQLAEIQAEVFALLAPAPAE